MAKLYGFNKAEKLKSRKAIDLLFKEGAWFTAPPVRLAYRLLPGSKNKAQAGVTVSKRYFKRAVDRNRIKRLLREAYRLQKKELPDAATMNGMALHLFFVYTDKELSSLETIKAAVGKCLQKLAKKIKTVRPPDQPSEKSS